MRAVCVFRRSSVFAVAVAATLAASPVVFGQSKSVAESSSLAFVPDDVAFYSSSLRTGEQLEVFLKSRAFAKIQQHPLVQMALAQGMSQWEEPQAQPVAIAKMLLQMPENQELVAMLQDAISREVFVAADVNVNKSLELLMEFSEQMNGMQMAIGADPGSAEDLIKERVLAMVSSAADELKVPGGMIGFKLSDTAPAKRQLVRLETLINGQLEQAPPEIAKRFGRSTIGEGEFLTLNLDGSLVPWDQVPFDELDLDESDVEKLVEKAKQLTAVISIGVIRDYLVISIGESTSNLENLGGGNLLVNRKEMAPLKKHLGKPLTSIAYVSETFMKSAGDQNRSLDSYVEMAKGALELPDAQDEISPQMKAEILADIGELRMDLQRYIVSPGAVVGFAWMKPTGFEGYVYNYAKNPRQQKDKPLTVLSHTGTSPLFVGAGHNGLKIEDYDLLVKWANRGYHYFETFAVPEMEEEELAEFNNAKDRFMPLIKRMDTNFRENLFPACNNGEVAFVLDGKAKSNSWHAAMPPSDKELPMPELAMVWGINDIGQVEAGFASMFGILDDGITQWNEMAEDDGDKIPLESFPRPDQNEIESGALYSYAIPAEAGLDTRVSPNWGLSPQTMVMSLLPETTKRLMPQSTSSVFFGPLADSKRPLAGAVYFDFDGIVEMLNPWIDYGVKTSMNGQDPDEIEQQVGMIMMNVDFVSDILSCFKGVSAAMYQEDGATVTHTESLYEDLP